MSTPVGYIESERLYFNNSVDLPPGNFTCHALQYNVNKQPHTDMTAGNKILNSAYVKQLMKFC